MISINLFFCCRKVFTLINKYRNGLEKFSEISLNENDDFYNLLNMEDITNADYTHRERICEDFELKRLGKSHYLYV